MIPALSSSSPRAYLSSRTLRPCVLGAICSTFHRCSPKVARRSSRPKNPITSKVGNGRGSPGCRRPSRPSLLPAALHAVWFSESVRGSVGKVPFKDRASLCAAGWQPCRAAEFLAAKRPTVHHFWLDDPLATLGDTNGKCAAVVTGGNDCAVMKDSKSDEPLGPMRVCAAVQQGPLGNRCHRHSCGYLKAGENAFFGGCSLTAGTLCCRTAP